MKKPSLDQPSSSEVGVHGYLHFQRCGVIVDILSAFLFLTFWVYIIPLSGVLGDISSVQLASERIGLKFSVELNLCVSFILLRPALVCWAGWVFNHSWFLCVYDCIWIVSS